MRFDDLELLAPCAKSAFVELAHILAADTPFQPFETYRGPFEQNGAYENGRSKARAFESPHQFGLAVDFVPRIAGNWTWNVPHELWDKLAVQAEAVGLSCPIPWDRAHVEHPAFKRVRLATRA